MMKITEGKYQQYRESAPFLFPLPSWLHRIITWPGKLVTSGDYPTRRIQVLWIVLIYTGICMALSLIWMDLGGSGKADASAAASQGELSEIMHKLDQLGDQRREIYPLMNEIPAHGEAGKDSLILLATHPNNHIREFALEHLGRMKVREAEDLMIRSLYDSIRRVRSSAILAVGQIQSERAVDSLVGMLVHPRQPNNTFHLYGALGDIGDPSAIPVLAQGLKEGAHYNQVAALDAIMRIDPQKGLPYVFDELNDPQVEIRRNAVITCIKTGDPSVIGPLSAMLDDEDFEVRFYAKQGIKRLKK